MKSSLSVLQNANQTSEFKLLDHVLFGQGVAILDADEVMNNLPDDLVSKSFT